MIESASRLSRRLQLVVNQLSLAPTLSPTPSCQRRILSSRTNYVSESSLTLPPGGNCLRSLSTTSFLTNVSTRTQTSTSQSLSTEPWLQRAVPKGFWANKENQRTFLDWLEVNLSYKSRDDWYRVSIPDFVRNHGIGLLKQYRNSPVRALRAIYSDHEFLPWLFSKTFKGYFKDQEHRLNYVEWLKNKVGVGSFEELKQVHFVENHGSGLLKMYGWSCRELLESLQPSSANVDEGLKRPHKPVNYWSSLANQRAFLDTIGPKIGVKGNDLSPWYDVEQTATLRRLGCAGLLRSHYDSSQYKMLLKVYPEHNWQAWKFKRLPANLGKDREVLDQALAFVEKERKLSEPQEWYRVSKADLVEHGVASLITQAGGLYEALKICRPGYQWEQERFSGAHHSERRYASRRDKETTNKK